VRRDQVSHKTVTCHEEIAAAATVALLAAVPIVLHLITSWLR
jgi:hypothetical protein